MNDSSTPPERQYYAAAAPPSPPMARPATVPMARPPVRDFWGPMRLPNVSAGTALRHLLFVLGALLVLPFIGSIALQFTLAIRYDDVDGLMRVITIEKGAHALLALIVALFLLKRLKLPPAAFGMSLRRPGWQWDAAWIPGATITVYIALITTSIAVFGVAQLLSEYFPLFRVLLRDELRSRTEFADLMPKGLLEGVLLMINVAIYEEVLFRGLLLPYLKRLTGYWWAAIVISSFIFGALHFTQGILAPLPLMAVGAVLAITVVLSRSIFPAIVAHFLFNVLQLQLIPVFLELSKSQQVGG